MRTAELTRACPRCQGGQIIFFQSVAVLGYCLFPLVVRLTNRNGRAAFPRCADARMGAQLASILCLAWRNMIYNGVLLGCGAPELHCSCPWWLAG